MWNRQIYLEIYKLILKEILFFLYTSLVLRTLFKDRKSEQNLFVEKTVMAWLCALYRSCIMCLLLIRTTGRQPRDGEASKSRFRSIDLFLLQLFLLFILTIQYMDWSKNHYLVANLRGSPLASLELLDFILHCCCPVKQHISLFNDIAKLSGRHVSIVDVIVIILLVALVDARTAAISRLEKMIIETWPDKFISRENMYTKNINETNSI